MKRHQQGSTLLEILVVIMVFTVGILGLVQIFPKSLSLIRSSRDGQSAEQLVKNKLKQIQSQQWKWDIYDNAKREYLSIPVDKKVNQNWRKFILAERAVSEYPDLILLKNGYFLMFSSIGVNKGTKLYGKDMEELQSLEKKEDLLNEDGYYEPYPGLGVYLVCPESIPVPELEYHLQYKVADWRNLTEDFSVESKGMYQLEVDGIKKIGDTEVDNTKYAGFWNKNDFVLLNLSTGELVSSSQYTLDYQKGLLRTNENFPLQTPLRAYYQKKGDWALHIERLKNRWVVTAYSNPFFFRLSQNEEKNTAEVRTWADQRRVFTMEAFTTP